MTTGASGNAPPAPRGSAPLSQQLRQQPLPQPAITAQHDAAGLAEARAIFQDYAESLGISLDFQDFAAELAALPGEYAEPRGVLLLARVDGAGSESSAVAGCCALRPLDAADYPNAAEMKRLYVRPAFRGLGLGRALAEAALDAARRAGYACVLLDTLDDMESARALYAELGFEEIAPYYFNPVAGAHYLKADL